jgi:hypothetical protein
MTDTFPISGSDTGQPDQKQHELKVSGPGKLSDALLALTQARDNLFIDAVNFKIGPGWSLTDIINRAEFVTHHDKREVFMFDGVAMVEFWPHNTTMMAHSLTITQKYRKLYSNKGIH